jgi:hypothetical protein
MDIENLEISLLQASKIKDGDTILVRLTEEDKKVMTKDQISQLYQKIKKCVGEEKQISIFFFPKSMELSLVKHTMRNVVESRIAEEVSEIDEETENDPSAEN